MNIRNKQHMGEWKRVEEWREVCSILENNGLSSIDLLVSLSFYQTAEEGTSIFIQCPSAYMIPYLRRSVKYLLGEPNKYYNNAMVYDNKRIVFLTLSLDDCLGLKEENLFYISLLDKEKEAEIFERYGIGMEERVAIIELWEDIGLSVRDICKALEADGLHPYPYL